MLYACNSSSSLSQAHVMTHSLSQTSFVVPPVHFLLVPPVSSSINPTSTPVPTKKISSPVSSTTSTLTSKSATSVSSTTSPNTSSLRQLRLKLNLPLALRRVRLQHDLRLLVKEAT